MKVQEFDEIWSRFFLIKILPTIFNIIIYCIVKFDAAMRYDSPLACLGRKMLQSERNAQQSKLKARVQIYLLWVYWSKVRLYNSLYSTMERYLLGSISGCILSGRLCNHTNKRIWQHHGYKRGLGMIAASGAPAPREAAYYICNTTHTWTNRY